MQPAFHLKLSHFIFYRLDFSEKRGFTKTCVMATLVKYYQLTKRITQFRRQICQYPKMAAAIQDFPQWLNTKLQELNADETVFGSYIQGILDSDETSEEKNEALQGILSEFVQEVSHPITILSI